MSKLIDSNLDREILDRIKFIKFAFTELSVEMDSTSQFKGGHTIPRLA